MDLELHDFVGFLGVIVIVLAYFFLQTKRMSVESLAYSLLNLIGAVLILFSLTYAWNLTAIIMEIVWAGVSVFGVIAWYQKKQRSMEK